MGDLPLKSCASEVRSHVGDLPLMFCASEVSCGGSPPDVLCQFGCLSDL